MFYRAAGACPWAKEVYMQAFGSLWVELSGSELRGLVNTMAAKGLRVHVDLEEFLEAWGKREGR